MEILPQEKGDPQKEMRVADSYAELKEDKNKSVLLVRNILSESDKLVEIIKGDLKLDPEFKEVKIKELSGLRMEVQETLDNLKFAVADQYKEADAA